jgi:two-component system chemotaxis response regulator CheB
MNKSLIRTLVIDDSAYSRRTLADILEASGECEVVGVARDGEDGIKKTLELKPDLITLDLEMPKMDGFTFLRILMKSQPTPVLVISTISQRKTVFRAMEMGAVDFLAKPDPRVSNDLYDIKEDLILKVKVVSQLKMLNVQKRVNESDFIRDDTPAPGLVQDKHHIVTPQKGPYDCLVIGSSTGGPSALQMIFSNLPANLPVSIAVSQHMPAGFTKAFAERLDKYSAWDVKEGQQGDALANGRALIAPGGYHMLLRRSGSEVRVEIVKRKPTDKYVPSIDQLFTTAGEIFGSSTLGVILTGMGNDGKEGAGVIKKAGGTIFAESEKTAIVYGMPKEAVAAGYVDQSLPLDAIAQRIAEMTLPFKREARPETPKS